VPTDGWRLGIDPDWRHVLEEVKRAGFRHVWWFTLLGLDATYDALRGRSGAFAAIVSALQRCLAVGLETGVNIVVSTRNTR
jgi:MoaA/NifB/PqqE/SkfB family radical SAM enzyme